MNSKEVKLTCVTAFLFATRVLGTVLMLPIITLYFKDSYPEYIMYSGLALSVYGLFQASLQFPFGYLSDLIGRKPIIILGLFLSCCGGIIQLVTQTLLGLIIGRAVQGMGAIGGVLLAVLTDEVSVKFRPLAMAVVGATIGSCFLFGISFGAYLYSESSFLGIQKILVVLSFFGLLISIFFIPFQKVEEETKVRPKLSYLLSSLKGKYIGAFMIHFMFTALFIAIPQELMTFSDISDHAQFYLFTILIASAFSLVWIVLSSSSQKKEIHFLISCFILLVSQSFFILMEQSLFSLGGCFVLFFIGFNFIEASLPALLATEVPKSSKGTVMGLYTFMQFAGAFTGASSGGFLMGHFNISVIYCLNAAMVFLYLLGMGYSIWYDRKECLEIVSEVS